MSHVHYKFKSSIDHDTVTFDGLSLSLGELKKLIMTKSKLPKSADFDLQVTNAQTNEVYKSDADMIARNTSVIVTRVPVGGTSGAGDEGVTAGAGMKGKEPAKAAVERLSKVTDLTKAQGSEEEKIMAMMNQASKDYSEANYIVKTRAPTGLPPASYICYRCGIKGHWIHNCPMQFQQKPDAMAFPGMMRGVKKTHGIPQSFLLPATKDTPGAMLTAIGTYAVPKMDAEAYARGKKEKPAFTENSDPGPINLEKIIPKELLCTLCNELLRDATVVPCCGVSFCDECVRKSLVEGDDDQECPACKRNIVPDQLIPNVFLRSTVTKFLSDSNLQPRRHAIVQSTTSSVSPSSQSQPLASGSPAHVATVKAEPSSAAKSEEVRPATPVVDEKPEAASSDPASAALPIAQSSSGTSTESSGSSADAQGQSVAVLSRKYANHNVEGPSQRPLGVRGHPSARGSSRHMGPAPGVVPVPHPAVLAAPVMHGPIPFGMPRFRTMAPAIPSVAPMAVGFGPRGAPFSMYPSAAIPPVMYMPAAPQHMPGAPVLTAEEFYKEKARLLEEELHKQKKSDPLDDFARELLDYKKDQRKRQRSRSLSRSRSRSRKKSGSRSPRRRYRSRSHSRSRSPYYRRAPRSSRSPYRRRSPSAVTSSPPPDFSRGRRSSSPYSRYQHSPSSRDRYSDEYYRNWFDDYFRRVDPHYNPRYFEDYYRNFYERYARGSPLADPFGVSARGAPFLSGYPLPAPHHDNNRGPYDYRHDFDTRQRNDDVSDRHRRRTSPSRSKNEDRSRRHASGSRRRSRGPSRERQQSRDRDDSRIKKDGDKDKRGTRKEKKTKREICESEVTPDIQDRNATDHTSSAKDANRGSSTLVTSEDKHVKNKKGDSKRKRAASGDHDQSSEDGAVKRKRHSVQEGHDRPAETSASTVKDLQLDASDAVTTPDVPRSGSSVEAPTVPSEQAAANTSTAVASQSEPTCTVAVAAAEPVVMSDVKSGSHETALKKSLTPLVNANDMPCGGEAAVARCSNDSTSGATALAGPSTKPEPKRKRPRSPSELSSSRTKLKKKQLKPVVVTSTPSADAHSRADVPSIKAGDAKDGSTTEGRQASSTTSGVPIKPPELSRWERDGDSSPEVEQSLKFNKIIEKSRTQSLPKSVIESAEKALMSKQPKPLISSALGVMSVSSGSGRSVAGPPVISVGSSSRKVFIGTNKESAATDVAHEGGIATDRKVQNVVSAAKITLSQDKGCAEEDACKDSRESCDRDRTDVPDLSEGRKTGSDKVHKSDGASRSRQHSDQHKRRDSKNDRQCDHDLDDNKGVADKGRLHKSEVKKSSRSVTAVRSDETRSFSGNRINDDGRSRSGTENAKAVIAVKEWDANEAKRTKADSASGRVSTLSCTDQEENRVRDGGRQVAGDGRANEGVDQRLRKNVDQNLVANDATVQSRVKVPTEPISSTVDTSTGSVPLSAASEKLLAVSVLRSQSDIAGIVEKSGVIVSEPSSIRLSDEASFNPDYDETTTQSTGGSESAASDDNGSAVHVSLSKDKDAHADVSDDISPVRHRSDRSKSSHSRHKKHKKHAKKHKKHKKHKKSSSTKV